MSCPSVIDYHLAGSFANLGLKKVRKKPKNLSIILVHIGFLRALKKYVRIILHDLFVCSKGSFMLDPHPHILNISTGNQMHFECAIINRDG